MGRFPGRDAADLEDFAIGNVSVNQPPGSGSKESTQGDRVVKWNRPFGCHHAPMSWTNTLNARSGVATGARLAFTWRQASFAPDQVTRVEVRFDPVGDETRVTVEHIGWDTMPQDHVARHLSRTPFSCIATPSGGNCCSLQWRNRRRHSDSP
jgi:hypothetical protein